MERGNWKTLNMLLLTILILPVALNHAEQNKVVEINELTLNALVDHGPINIEYDSNFSDYGFPGIGTPADPYRIENYNITVTSEYPIVLGGDTTKYFVIQDCFLKTDTNIGIYLGKYADMADGTVKILNNIIITENNIGIEMNGGKYSLISGNTFTCYGDGIMIYGPSDFTIISNNVINNMGLNTGIIIENSANNTITKNTLVEGWRGIYLYNSADSAVTHNNCSDIQFGIVMNYANTLTVTNNRVIQSINTGMLIDNCDDSIFTNNLVQWSQDYGLEISGTNNIIHHNVFDGNNGGGTQAKDDGSNNIWFDTVSLEGNWYSDWTSGPYSIDGSAGAVDLYPLNYIPEISEFSEMLLIILSFVSVLAMPVIVLVRKKI